MKLKIVLRLNLKLRIFDFFGRFHYDIHIPISVEINILGRILVIGRKLKTQALRRLIPVPVNPLNKLHFFLNNC